jgi:hypothetical protein
VPASADLWGFTPAAAACAAVFGWAVTLQADIPLIGSMAIAGLLLSDTCISEVWQDGTKGVCVRRCVVAR